MINCIAIDDEPLALELLVDNIKKVPFLHLISANISVTDALQIINTQKIDLIFLDIEMPDINGIQLIKSLSDKPMTIFITAYDKYAIQGYELDVIDYLLKPVLFDRFLKAAQKANEFYHYKHKKADVLVKSECESLFVRSEHRIIKINIDDILYIESLKDYVKIFCGDKPILTLMSLKLLEDLLPDSKFIRIHRSYIISINKINYISRSKIFINEIGIPISNFYRDKLFSVIKQDSED